MYAVVDTETTGISPRLHHRVIEVALVLVDAAGQVEDRWCTLLNPDRDLGPQHIHGIRGADVLDAPRFDDIAGHLIGLLHGRTLVAHNLPFDLTFLDAEYDRLGVPFPVTREMGICTMSWSSRFLPGSGRSLRECCAAAGVALTGWHSAQSDAQATAGLLSCFLASARGDLPWHQQLQEARNVLWPTMAPGNFAVCTRSMTPAVPAVDSGPLLNRIVDYMPRVDSSELADPYLAVLDQTLADRYLSADENAALATLARSLGLTDLDTARLHRDYLNALARLALADHHLSEDETNDLEQVAEILGLPEGAVHAALERAGQSRPTPAGSLPLAPGDLVVFTGDMPEPREVWMQRAVEHGYVPHPSVTKKVCLVVAADTGSLSGKAKKARGYDIPLMSVDDFRTALGYPPPEDGQTGAGSSWSGSERRWAKILRGDSR